jgi:hypothetical protein
MPRTFSFPHGATGIEVGDFVLQVGTGKVVALAKGRDEHYTLHFGEASGVLDVHRTWKDEGGTIRHKTVFAMLHSDIPAVLDELAPTTPDIFRRFRKLRVGWMHRHGIGIVRGLEPFTDADIEAVTRKRPRRKRIVVDEEKVKANIFIPEYLDDVWDMTDGAFSLFRRSKRIGIGFKVTDGSGRSRLFWFKPTDITLVFKKMHQQLILSASRYAIPPDRYYEFHFLEP